MLLEKETVKAKAEENAFQSILSTLVDNDNYYICMPCV